MIASRKILAGIALVALAACGSGKQSSSAQGAPGYKYSLADGPGICIAKVKEKLGDSAMISEIDAHFSQGPEIDSNTSEPIGALEICTAQYQDPSNPLKLVEIRMNSRTGDFGDPRPVELTVMGDADSFKLSDHLMPLGKVDPSVMKTFYDAQVPALGKRFSKYTIGMARLMPPDEFHNKFALRLDVDGRLPSNDIKGDGFVVFSLDGKTVLTDDLTKS